MWTSPTPFWKLSTTTTRDCGPRKRAIVSCAALTVSVHVVSEPMQAPDHPMKTESPTGLATSVTRVPSAYVYGQACGDPPRLSHIAPGGSTLTVPIPPSTPSTRTVRSAGLVTTFTVTTSAATPPKPSRTVRKYWVVVVGLTTTLGDDENGGPVGPCHW